MDKRKDYVRNHKSKKGTAVAPSALFTQRRTVKRNTLYNGEQCRSAARQGEQGMVDQKDARAKQF